MLGRYLMIILGIALLSIPASSEKIEVGTFEVLENSTFSVPVIAENLVNIAGFDISLRYDPDVIQFVSYSIGSDVGQNFHFDRVDSENGSVRFIVVVNKAINAENITVALVNFRAVGAPGSQSELRLYAELSRVVEGEQTSFQTVTPECVGGVVYIKSQSQTEPAKTPTPASPPIPRGGGGYVDITAPSPTKTPTPTPTPVETQTPETGNLSLNESDGLHANLSVHETKESDNLGKGHVGVEKPTAVPTEMANMRNKTYAQNESGKVVETTPAPERGTGTRENGIWSIPGFEATLSTVLVLAAGFALRKR